MEPLDPTSQPPSRIPRPTFRAALPRTPSIRAVPYSHMDQVATASKAVGGYSPSSWPFPKSTKPSPIDTTTQAGDASGDEIELQDMSQRENMRSSHHATSSATSVPAKMASIRETGQRGRAGGHARACDSFGSAETQIYVPKCGDSSASAEHSRPMSTRGSFLGPKAEFSQRPMTPTPYSALRKVSEATEPENEDEFRHEDTHGPTRASQHQEIIRRPSAVYNPRGSSIQESPAAAIIAKRTMDTSLAHITPVLRAGEGRAFSPTPLPSSYQANASNRELEVCRSPAAHSSLQAENGSSKAGPATRVPVGIAILEPAQAAEALGAIGTLAGNSSRRSQRRSSTESEYPDIESLRRGPRLRHNRLPQSVSMATNAGRDVPESTKQLWTAIGQSRRMMLASAILLELSVVNIVASITAVIVAHITDGHPRAGLVAWAVVSSVLVVTFGGLLAVNFLRYRKTNKDLISGETWIEMTVRSRPLPSRPKSGELKQDTGATEAWEKFAQDHEQLRCYVESLESRIGVLEEDRQNAKSQNEVPNGDTVGVDIRTPGNMGNDTTQTNAHDGGGDKTPKAKTASLDGSLSHRQLLRPESWQGSDSNDAIPRSDTKTSILTELCEAVTEGYSPLAEHTNPGSPYIPPPPSAHRMPSASPRDDTFRRLG